jgi:hypothetical protein
VEEGNIKLLELKNGVCVREKYLQLLGLVNLPLQGRRSGLYSLLEKKSRLGQNHEIQHRVRQGRVTRQPTRHAGPEAGLSNSSTRYAELSFGLPGSSTRHAGLCADLPVAGISPPESYAMVLNFAQTKYFSEQLYMSTLLGVKNMW